MIITKENQREVVKHSALLLDGEVPGWENHISSNMYMGSPTNCVCSQLRAKINYTGHYLDYQRAFASKLDNYTDLTAWWQQEVADRKNKVVRDITWAVAQIKAGQKVQRASWSNNKCFVSSNHHVSLRSDDFLGTDWQIYKEPLLFKNLKVGQKFNFGSYKNITKINAINVTGQGCGLNGDNLVLIVSPEEEVELV